MSHILERGDIYFLYKPAEGETDVGGLSGVRRFFMVLKPAGEERLRSLVVGQKKLPVEEAGREGRFWGFVDRVAARAEDLREDLEAGDRPARPVGEGVYAIVRHENHTDLAYALELPEAPGEAQRDLGITKEAAFILTIKNPQVASPAGAGLEPDERAEFPAELMMRFHDHRWAAADPPAFLDHEGAEFLLVSGREGDPSDVGVALEPEQESRDSADVLRDLQIARDDRVATPLFEGSWT